MSTRTVNVSLKVICFYHHIINANTDDNGDYDNDYDNSEDSFCPWSMSFS